MLRTNLTGFFVVKNNYLIRELGENIFGTFHYIWVDFIMKGVQDLKAILLKFKIHCNGAL